MTEREQMATEALRGILSRYGDFMTGYDADDDVLDIDGALEAILSLTDPKGNRLLAVRAKDQSLPDNPIWHRDAREWQAYCAGRNDMLNDNWVKIEKGE